MRGSRLVAGFCAAALALSACADEAFGRRVFDEPRDPPPFESLSGEARARYELGDAVFNTHFEPAGKPGVSSHDGLGPRTSAAACDACHNSGARARAIVGDGPTPAALVMQLDPYGVRLPAGGDTADRNYGHALNTGTIPGFEPEAAISVRYREREGRFADGERWSLRAPEYRIDALALGPLPRATVLRPRIAPAIFGAGLLARVPDSAIAGADSRAATGRVASRVRAGKHLIGRYGWQGSATSLDDQTARALSRDMGLTSRGDPIGDCGISDGHCRAAPNGGEPEVEDRLFDALLAFQAQLAVPAPLAPADGEGARLFRAIGCARCHRSSLPIDAGARRIEAYTDLRLHDLGRSLADRTVAGQPVRTVFRTAPLWGLGQALAREPTAALLHDGRARNVTEAVLWHGGEALAAHDRFLALDHDARKALFDFVSTR